MSKLRRFRLTILLVALMLLALGPLSGRAQAPPGVAVPHMAALGYTTQHNSYLMVWAEDRGLGTGLDVYAQRLTVSGVPVGAPWEVVKEPGDQSDPALAYDERNDDFLVLFVSQAGSLGFPTPPSPGGPGPTPPGPPPPPPPPPPFRIQMQGRPHQPQQVPTPMPLPTTTPGGPPPSATATSLPSATAPGPSPTSVPPTATSPAATDLDIFGRHVTISGVPVSAIFPVAAGPGDQTQPDLVFNPGRVVPEWVVGWREKAGLGAQQSTTLKVQRFAAFSFGLGIISSPVDLAGTGEPSHLSLARSLSGEFMALWSMVGTADRDVFARRLNTNAFPRGLHFQVQRAAGEQVHPSISNTDRNDGFLATFQDDSAPTAPDVVILRLNPAGRMNGPARGVAVGPSNSTMPDVESANPTGRALVVWSQTDPASGKDVLIVAQLTDSGVQIGPPRIVWYGGTGHIRPPTPTSRAAPFPVPPIPPIPPPP